MYPGIDLRLQRYAVVLAEELSFSNAARRLHLDQSALSRAIRQLEEEVGAKLFDRTSRKVRVTEAGQRFVAEARKILHHSGRLLEVVKLGEVPDKLVVGYPCHLDVRHIIQFSKVSVPGLRIQQFIYQSLSTAEILTALRNRTIDCGIIALPNEYPEVLEFTTVRPFRHQLGIAVRKDHPLATKRNLHLRDLNGQPLIFIKKEINPHLHTWLERQCRAADFAPNIVQEIHHQHDYAALVLDGAGIGLGFGFWRAWYNRQLFPNLVLRTFRNPHLGIEIAVLFSERFNFRPLNGFVTALLKRRGKYTYNDRTLALSA